MKKFRSMVFISIGFLAGVIWIAACGGGSASIAETIATALEVSYDNATSGLTAETVQAAIDELKAGEYTDADAQAALADQDLTLGAVTADSFTFAAVKTGYLSVPGIAFFPGKPFNDGNDDGASGVTVEYGNTLGARHGDEALVETTFYAPVYLPNAAAPITLSGSFTDGGAGESVSLIRYNPTTNAEASLGLIDSDTTSNDISGVIAIDNATNAYYLKAVLPDSNYAIRRVLITYTYTTPTF